MHGPGRMAKSLVVLGFSWWLLAVAAVLLRAAFPDCAAGLCAGLGVSPDTAEGCLAAALLFGGLAMAATWFYCLHYAYYSAPFGRDQRFGCILGLALLAPLAVPYLIFAHIVRTPAGGAEGLPGGDAAVPGSDLPA